MASLGCITCKFAASNCGISEVRSLPGVDATELAASPLIFPGWLACRGSTSERVAVYEITLFTGNFVFVGMILMSAPLSAMLSL